MVSLQEGQAISISQSPNSGLQKLYPGRFKAEDWRSHSCPASTVGQKFYCMSSRLQNRDLISPAPACSQAEVPRLEEQDKKARGHCPQKRDSLFLPEGTGLRCRECGASCAHVEGGGPLQRGMEES